VLIKIEWDEFSEFSLSPSLHKNPFNSGTFPLPGGFLGIEVGWEGIDGSLLSV